MKKINLLGKKINRWTIISQAESFVQPSGQTKSAWLCKCDCGKEKIISYMNLANGKSKSCGCLAIETHTTHALSGHTLFTVHSHIVQRCYNKKCKSYVNYGARGITMCDEWRNDFMSFYNFCINNGWNESLEIDRIDNDKNYEPSNVRFVTHRKNNLNKRRLCKRNKSGYEGVHFSKSSNKWVTQIRISGKVYSLGGYDEKLDAVKARNSFIKANKLEDDYKIQQVV